MRLFLRLCVFARLGVLARNKSSEYDKRVRYVSRKDAAVREDADQFSLALVVTVSAMVR